jgi:hypothetical protein
MPKNANSERYYKYKLVVLDDFNNVIDRKYFTHINEAISFTGIGESALRYQLTNVNHKTEFWRVRRFTKVNIDRLTTSLYTYTYDANMVDIYDTDDENVF